MKIIPTSVRNLVLEANYQIYYVRLRIGGRLYFRSLAERDLAQAQLKLPAKLAEIRDAAAKRYVALRLISRMTFREAVETYTGDFENDPRLAPRTKVVRRNAIAAVRRTWPAVFERELREISHARGRGKTSQSGSPQNQPL